MTFVQIFIFYILFKPVGMKPTASIESVNAQSETLIETKSSPDVCSNNEPTILKDGVDDAEDLRLMVSEEELDVNEIPSDSFANSNIRDNDVDSEFEEELVKECTIKENVPSKSNDFLTSLSPVNEEVTNPASTIQHSQISLNGNEEENQNEIIEPEHSKVHLNFNESSTIHNASNSQINSHSFVQEKRAKDPSNEASATPNSIANDQPSTSASSSIPRQVQSMPPVIPPAQKTYDYLLKVLLVGDSDVGKQEIISDMEDGTTDSPFCSSAGAGMKTIITKCLKFMLSLL